MHNDAPRPWLFPRLVEITKQWLAGYVTTDPDVPVGMLLLAEGTAKAADRIFGAIVYAVGARPELLRPLIIDAEPGSTDGVSFQTRRKPIPTEHSHVSHVVVDSGWEETLSEFLEHHPQVAAYVKNDHIGFTIPYVFAGVRHEFWPDFLVRLTSPDGVERTLIVEVSGGRKDQAMREAKAATARDQWCPAVNHHGGYGHWSFVEIDDMTHAAHMLNTAIADLAADGLLSLAAELGV